MYRKSQQKPMYRKSQQKPMYRKKPATIFAGFFLKVYFIVFN
jgi:hypothetical protein